MGLYDKLLTAGSGLSTHDGATPPTNPLATNASELHYTYSLNGKNFSTTNSQYQAYEDGVVNLLPNPSQLDLDGKTPPKYTDNLPR